MRPRDVVRNTLLFLVTRQLYNSVNLGKLFGNIMGFLVVMAFIAFVFIRSCITGE